MSSATAFQFYICLNNTDSMTHYQAFSITHMVFNFPLCTFVLYAGLRRRRQQRSFVPSHSDIITHHFVVMKVFGIVGSLSLSWGTMALTNVVRCGYYAFLVSFYGEVQLHVLNCVDHYLAIVHPIVYKGLKNTRGIKITNICACVVWIQSFAWVGIYILSYPEIPYIPSMIALMTIFLVVCFCNLSVIHVLLCEMPGKAKKKKVGRRQKRAFTIITIINLVLGFWFLSYISSAFIVLLPIASDVCVMNSRIVWLNMCTGFTLPCLYLHRAGKFAFRC